MVKRDADLLAEKRISKIISTINFSEQYNPIVPNYIISEPAQQIGDDGLPIHDEEEGGEEERFYAEHELTFGGEEEACPYIIMHAKDGTLFDFLYRDRPTWINALLELGGMMEGDERSVDPYTAMLVGIFKETVDNVRYLVTKDLYYTDLKLENLLYQVASPHADAAFDWDHPTDNIKIYLADIGGIVYNGASDRSTGWGPMRNQIMNEIEVGQTVEMLTPDKRWNEAKVQSFIDRDTGTYRLEDGYHTYDVPRERIRVMQWPTFSYAAMGSRKGPSPLPYGKGSDLAPGQINDVTLMNFYHQLIVLALQVFFIRRNPTPGTEAYIWLDGETKSYMQGMRGRQIKLGVRGYAYPVDTEYRTGTPEQRANPNELLALTQLTKSLNAIYPGFLDNKRRPRGAKLQNIVSSKRALGNGMIYPGFPNLLGVIEKFWHASRGLGETCDTTLDPLVVQREVESNLTQLASAFDEQPNEELRQWMQANRPQYSSHAGIPPIIEERADEEGAAEEEGPAEEEQLSSLSSSGSDYDDMYGGVVGVREATGFIKLAIREATAGYRMFHDARTAVEILQTALDAAPEDARGADTPHDEQEFEMTREEAEKLLREYKVM